MSASLKATQRNFLAAFKEEIAVKRHEYYVENKDRINDCRREYRDKVNAKSRENNKHARLYFEVRKEFKSKYQPWVEGGIVKVN